MYIHARCNIESLFNIDDALNQKTTANTTYTALSISKRPAQKFGKARKAPIESSSLPPSLHLTMEISKPGVNHTMNEKKTQVYPTGATAGTTAFLSSTGSSNDTSWLEPYLPQQYSRLCVQEKAESARTGSGSGLARYRSGRET